jgi:hypothetical protein
MTQILLFTGDSADQAIRNLHHPAKFLYTRTLTSKLISLQIKQEMYDLAHDATGYLLRDLEDAMLNRGNDTRVWASSFCVISILCMCVETVQVATDFKIVHSMTEEEGVPKLSRDESRHRCQHLDEHLISTWEKMFHQVFKSYKRHGIRKHERGFNPIRDGLEFDNAKGLDEAIVRLVIEVRKVATEQGQCPPHQSA